MKSKWRNNTKIWENIFANYMPEKGMASGTYRKLQNSKAEIQII